MLESLLFILLGLVVGFGLSFIVFVLRYENGKFEIDSTDEDELYRMNIRKLDKLHKRKFILLHIDKEAKLRQNNIDYYENK